MPGPSTGIYHLSEPQDDHGVKPPFAQASDRAKVQNRTSPVQASLLSAPPKSCCPAATGARRARPPPALLALRSQERWNAQDPLAPRTIHAGGATRGPYESSCAVAGARTAVSTLTSAASLKIADSVTVGARFLSLFSSTLSHSSSPPSAFWRFLYVSILASYTERSIRVLPIIPDVSKSN